MTGLVEVSGLCVDYGRVRAVDGVDLTVAPGEILGLVGESGCGKSTLGRAVVGLEPAAAGTVTFAGSAVTSLGRRKRSGQLRKLQMVFQDPYSSLNPRRLVGDLIGDGVVLGGGSRAAAAARVTELLDRVGLPADAASKYPHEFSGGQRQRIAIARTLAADPECLIADEPISALDASAQAQVSNLLGELVRDTGLALVFISHDLSVVRQVADRVAVMYLGRIVEVGPTEKVWTAPVHPYTEALIGRGDISMKEAEDALRDYQGQLEHVFNEVRELERTPAGPSPSVEEEQLVPVDLDVVLEDVETIEGGRHPGRQGGATRVP